MAKNPHAEALGRLGGKRRAQVLSQEERQEIARNAGLARVAKASADEMERPDKTAAKTVPATSRKSNARRSPAKPPQPGGARRRDDGRTDRNATPHCCTTGRRLTITATGGGEVSTLEE